jgi:hypothetical protein
MSYPQVGTVWGYGSSAKSGEIENERKEKRKEKG